MAKPIEVLLLLKNISVVIPNNQTDMESAAHGRFGLSKKELTIVKEALDKMDIRSIVSVMNDFKVKNGMKK